ncbi:hypothetical protein EDB87DRAFT_1685318 [Lactarius vividus]|nr:hypothetical protein EDB87DRAFT_1685318 [Lactarius vividus]
MPAGSRKIADDFLHSWEAFDRTFAAQPASPSSGEESVSLDLHPPRNRPMAPEPFSTPPFHSQASTSSSGPVTPDDSESLDRVWSAVRKAKEREMQASPSKIKSLERGRSPPILHSPLRGLPLEPSTQPAARVPSPAPPLRRQRSIVEFKESSDGSRVRVVAIDAFVATNV